MTRYRIATLLALTALVALAITWFRPFRPELRVFEIVDLDKRHSYNADAKNYELTIANSGSSTIWVPGNDEPASDVTFESDPGTENYTFVNILFDDRAPVRLDPGAGLTYDLYVTARFRNIDIGIDVADWRGRQAFFETPLRFVGDDADGG
ncbi:hypothetical protein [Crateriforma conspicua]|nr:hypothetical protein [Crateriforma conspicua]